MADADETPVVPCQQLMQVVVGPPRRKRPDLAVTHAVTDAVTHAVTHAVCSGDVAPMLSWNAAASGEAVFGVVSAQHVAAALPKVTRYSAVNEQAEMMTDHAARTAVHVAVEGSKQPSNDAHVAQKQCAVPVLAAVANLTEHSPCRRLTQGLLLTALESECAGGKQ